MSLTFRRNKIATFRLSSEEYHAYQRMCAEHGVRSISDLARTALHRLSEPQSPPDGLSHQIHDLCHRLDALSNQIDRLTQLVEDRR